MPYTYLPQLSYLTVNGGLSAVPCSAVVLLSLPPSTCHVSSTTPMRLF